MMEKEAKSNLKIIISAVILLVVMSVFGSGVNIVIHNLMNGTRLSAANNSFVINITIEPTDGEYATPLNVSNVTFWYNSSGKLSTQYALIGTNQTAGGVQMNFNSTTIGWDISNITNGTYTINITLFVNSSADASVAANSTAVFNISVDGVLASMSGTQYPEDQGSTTQFIKVTPDDANIDTCKVYVNSSNGIDINFTTANFTNSTANDLASLQTWTIDVLQSGYTNGTYNWIVWCNDTFGNVNESLFETNYSFNLVSNSLTVLPVNINGSVLGSSSDSLNFVDYPITVGVNVTGSNIDSVWYILTNVASAVGPHTNETIYNLSTHNISIIDDTTNPRLVNISTRINSIYRNPGAHGVWFCANTTGGDVHCNNVDAPGGLIWSGQQAGFTIEGVNVTQLISTFNGSVLGNLTVFYENGTALTTLSEGEFVSPSLYNYTFRINMTDDLGYPVVIEIDGIDINETYLANIRLSNLTVNEGNALQDQVGHGYNLTVAWFEIANFVPSANNYKYGRAIYDKYYNDYYYCGGTFSNPSCSEISNCSASTNGKDIWGINYTNHEDYIPTDSACYIEEDGNSYIYMDHFSGALGSEDVVAPNVTFNYPISGTNVSNNGTYINISFADAGTGIDNSSIRIDFEGGTTGVSPFNFTIANLTTACYDRSDVSSTNPVNASHVECYFNLFDYGIHLSDGSWNISGNVTDSNRTITVARLNFTVDTVAPTFNAWNITNTSIQNWNENNTVSNNNTGHNIGILQGSSITAFINFTDAASDVKHIILQMYNDTTDSWTTVQNDTNASHISDGSVYNITYALSNASDSFQSGHNVSFRMQGVDYAGNVNTSGVLIVQVNDSAKPLIQVGISQTSNTSGFGGNLTNMSSTSFWVEVNISEKQNLTIANISIDGALTQTGNCSNYLNLTTAAVPVTLTNLTTIKGTDYRSQFTSPEIFHSSCGTDLGDEQSHWVVVTAQDSWGNIETVNYTFTVDTRVPYDITLGYNTSLGGTVSGVAEGLQPFNISNYAWVSINVSSSSSGLRTLQYNTSCNSALATVQNNTDFQPFNNTLCLAATSGTKDIMIKATSTAGGVNTTTYSIGLDRHAPDITLNSIESVAAASIEGVEFTENMSLNFSTPTETTYLSSIGYYLDGGAYTLLVGGNIDQKLSYNYTINVSYGGKHTLTLQANDSVGNTANATTYTFTTVGSIDVDGKASELNLSLGDTHIAGLNITNASNGAIIEGGYVLINSSETLLVDIKLLMNSSSTSSVNVTIDDINASEASWQNLNFTVTSNAEIDELNIRRNFSAAVLRFVRFNGSTMSDFIPNTNAYFGRVEVGYNLSEARIINGSVFVAMWFTNVSDYSSRTLIDPCTTATGGATTPYTPTKTTPCFNVTNNISSTIFVPSFSAVVVVNDTMAPTVTVNHPQKNEGDSAFILNVTVSQDTSSCQWMINTSAYYDGTDSVRTSWVDMTTPSLLSGTSLYTCQSLLPIGLANFSSSKLGMYNITLNITDNAGNQNITAYIFNVTDSVMPTYTNLTNDSISSSGATIGIESNEYVNASVRYTVGMSPTSSIVTSQSSPFTTKKPIITLSLAPSSYINYSVKVCDVAGICNTTGVYNFTTAGEEDSSGDDTTTTGTGGGVTVAKANNVAAKTSHLWSSLAAGESISMKISNNKIAFKEVKVTTANALTSMKLEVASLKEMPSSLTEASDKVYQYLQVTKTNLADSDVDTATIKFEVTKVWLAESGVAEDDVVLLRYVDGKWNVLTTDKLESGDLTATYIANTPGFSYFAIGSKKGAKTEAPADTPTTDEPTDIPPGESGEGVTEPVKPISTAIWVIIAIVAIIIIAVIIYSAQTKKKH